MHRLGKLSNLQKKSASTEAAYCDGKLNIAEEFFKRLEKKRSDASHVALGNCLIHKKKQLHP